jgi:hypothetical protein
VRQSPRRAKARGKPTDQVTVSPPRLVESPRRHLTPAEALPLLEPVGGFLTAMNQSMPFLNTYLSDAAPVEDNRIGCAVRWGDSIRLIDTVTEMVLATVTNTPVPDEHDPEGLRLWHGPARRFDLAEMNRCWEWLRLAVTQVREICQAAQRTEGAAPDVTTDVPCFDDEDRAILRTLHRYAGILQNRERLAGKSLVSEKTISSRMPRLEQLKLVVRKREKGGWTITPAGSALIERLDEIDPPKVTP